MQLTGNIAIENLMSLEAYTKFRKTNKAAIIAQRRLRSVHLGEHMTLQFESELTIRYQIQEMLRIEKIFDEEGIQREIEAYSPLVPSGTNWKATVLLEYPDELERKRELAKLIGVEDHLYIQAQGCERVYAFADEDLERENALKTSAVHFVRFEFNQDILSTLKAGSTVVIGCDHAHYCTQMTIKEQTTKSLISDLK